MPREAARVRDLERAGDADRAVDRGGKEDAELVDHTGRHHRSVHVAAAFDEEPLDDDVGDTLDRWTRCVRP